MCILAACSGGGGVAPTAQQTVPGTPNGTSPGSVKPVPMVQTAILPASAMTSRTPFTAIVPQAYTQIPGSATQVTAAADGSIWVLSDLPAGADKNIWHYSGGTWTNVGGLASQIAVAPNGDLFAINSAGTVYRHTSGGWTGLGGLAQSVTALADSSVVVAANAGGGANNRALWRFTGGVWVQQPGSGSAVFGSIDASSHVLSSGTVSPGGFYVVNSSSSIYYENTNGTFVQIPSTASQLASAPGGIFAFGAPYNTNGNSLFYFDYNTAAWTPQTGLASSISSSATNLFVISPNDGIYSTPLATSPNPLTANPSSVAIVGAGATFAQGFIVSETGYTDLINETDTCSGIATLAPSSGTGSPLSVTATGVAAGSCVVTYHDNNSQTATVNITVTTGSVTVH